MSALYQISWSWVLVLTKLLLIFLVKKSESNRPTDRKVWKMKLVITLTYYYNSPFQKIYWIGRVFYLNPSNVKTAAVSM